jgi:1-phosphofructokinase family hexose kinase
MIQPEIQSIVTVTLNPTVDRIMEVPGLCIGGHLRGWVKSRLPAGKAINVSRALAALSVENTAIGFVGQDTVGDFDATAHEVGFVSRFTPFSGPTRENITLIDPTTSVETHIRDVGAPVTPEDIRRLTEVLNEVARPGTVVVFTGSAAPGLSAEMFGRLLDACIDKRAPVVVDASGSLLQAAAERPIWMIKPNLLELSELVGHDLHDPLATLEAGRKLAERIPIVLVTVGEKGAYCITREGVWFARVEIPKERTRSTVGCGDSLLAGFLAAVRDPNLTLDAALASGVAVAAASAMQDQPAVFDPRDVMELKPQVRIEQKTVKAA